MKIIAQLNRSSRIQLGSSKRKSCKGLDLKKSDTSRINDLMTLLKGLEKKQEAKQKCDQWQEITKIRIDANEI